VQIQQEIRDFIGRDMSRNVAQVQNGDSLLETGILDSLGVLALVSFIENRYAVAISDDELLPENFDSIDAIASFVSRRRGRDSA